MKKLMKLFVMVAALTALPVAFTGGATKGSLGVGISQACADGGPCLFALGSYCTGRFNRRESTCTGVCP